MLYSMCNWGMDGHVNFAPTIANWCLTSGDLSNVFDRDNPQGPCAELDGLDCKVTGYQMFLDQGVDQGSLLSLEGISCCVE